MDSEVDKYMLEAWFRARCELCGADTEETRPGLCRGCAADLAPVGRHCLTCTRGLVAGRQCGDCLRNGGAAQRICAAVRYDPLVATLVQRLKFERRDDLVAALAALMLERLDRHELGWAECLVPVPLHPARRRERGFDQALELALALGGALRCPVDDRWLQRMRATSAQSSLDARARRGNVRQAFRAVARRGWRRVVLVDDVITTGATVAAARQALVPCSPADVEVHAWAFAAATL